MRLISAFRRQWAFTVVRQIAGPFPHHDSVTQEADFHKGTRQLRSVHQAGADQHLEKTGDTSADQRRSRQCQYPRSYDASATVSRMPTTNPISGDTTMGTTTFSRIFIHWTPVSVVKAVGVFEHQRNHNNGEEECSPCCGLHGLRVTRYKQINLLRIGHPTQISPPHSPGDGGYHAPRKGKRFPRQCWRCGRQSVPSFEPRA